NNLQFHIKLCPRSNTRQSNMPMNHKTALRISWALFNGGSSSGNGTNKVRSGDPATGWSGTMKSAASLLAGCTIGMESRMPGSFTGETCEEGTFSYSLYNASKS